MPEPANIIVAFNEVWEETLDDGLSLAERASLYSLIRVLESDLRIFIEEDMNGDGYTHEKLSKYRWHMGALLGFDQTNDLGNSHHRSAALGQLHTLQDLIHEQIGN